MWNRLDSKIKPGDIILSHNGTKHTSDSLEMLLTKIQEKGYQIVKVSDLIYPDNSIIDVNGVQKRQKQQKLTFYVDKTKKRQYNKYIR